MTHGPKQVMRSSRKKASQATTPKEETKYTTEEENTKLTFGFNLASLALTELAELIDKATT